MTNDELQAIKALPALEQLQTNLIQQLKAVNTAIKLIGNNLPQDDYYLDTDAYMITIPEVSKR